LSPNGGIMPHDMQDDSSQIESDTFRLMHYRLKTELQATKMYLPCHETPPYVITMVDMKYKFAQQRVRVECMDKFTTFCSPSFLALYPEIEPSLLSGNPNQWITNDDQRIGEHVSFCGSWAVILITQTHRPLRRSGRRQSRLEKIIIGTPSELFARQDVVNRFEIRRKEYAHVAVMDFPYSEQIQLNESGTLIFISLDQYTQRLMMIVDPINQILLHTIIVPPFNDYVLANDGELFVWRYAFNDRIGVLRWDTCNGIYDNRFEIVRHSGPNQTICDCNCRFENGSPYDFVRIPNYEIFDECSKSELHMTPITKSLIAESNALLFKSIQN